MEDDPASMGQEDQRISDGGGNGRSSKKQKVKKVPQRGLGVAQLEKIIEEQQKRDACGAVVLPSPSSLSSTKTSHISLPTQNFHSSNQHHPSIPLLCGPPSDLRSPLSLQLQQQHHMNPRVSNTVPLANSGAFEVPGQRNVPKWWSSFEFDIERGNFGVDPVTSSPPSLPFEPNPMWPLSNSVHRMPEFQHQLSSPMVNVSPATSTPVSQFFMEPPSNQNYNGSIVPVRPVEKMVGVKRPYPFSLEVPQSPAFNYKLSPFAEVRTNAKASCSSGSEYNFDEGYSTLREVPSCPNSQPNLKNRKKGNENFKGDFLTLALPSPASCPPSMLKSSPTFLAFHNQGKTEDQIPTPPLHRKFNQRKQPFYRFLPPEVEEEQNGQTTDRIQNSHGVGGSVDLSLKL